MRRNRLFAAMLASAMLTTSVFSPAGNLTVKAMEVVDVESEIASEGTKTETVSNETEAETTENVSNETEAETTENVSDETEAEIAEPVSNETEAETTENVSDETEVGTTEPVSNETEIEVTDTEEVELTETEDSQKVILNDETGIPDAKLYQEILKVADVNKDNILTVEEAGSVSKLSLGWKDISNLKGIEYCTQLKELALNYNKISDTSALAGLANLTNLSLSNNQISDISSLAGLSNLTSLDVSNNQLTTVELKGLANLTSLSLYNNQLTSVKLSDLTNLTSLSLYSNQLTTIELTNLTKLESLGLYDQKLTDIKLSGLTSLTRLDLDNNQISDVSGLAGLTNLEYLYLYDNAVTDISPLADLALKYNLKYISLNGNPIETIGNFPDYPMYEEEVEVRYLTEADRVRVIEIFGLREYDGKVICTDGDAECTKFSVYGERNFEYGYDCDILRNENGELVLARNISYDDNDMRYAFSGPYVWDDEEVRLTVAWDGDNVWFLCHGDAAASGLNFTDKIEKTTKVDAFAKRNKDVFISKSYERDYNVEKEGMLNEQDLKTVWDFFGFSSYSGAFGLIPTSGSEYKIDFDASSYGKDELWELDIIYYTLARDAEGQLVIEYMDDEWYTIKNGKLDNSSYHEWDEEVKFLTKGDIGMDIEDCTFYLPAMEQENVLMVVRLYTLNGWASSSLITYNDAKTIELCKFAEVKDPDEAEDGEENEKYEVELPADTTIISNIDFKTVLKENETKDIVINSNGVSFTFKKGTMSAVDGVTYDFGTELISDLAKAGDMGESVTKDNFITRINFNYEGKLPAAASIRFYVGTDLAGKTLHYSHILENGYRHLQSVVVDENGYITVTQDHCSDYVVTTEKIGTEAEDNNNEQETTDDNNKQETTDKSPDTSDMNDTVSYMSLLVCSVIAFIMAMQKKLNR